jgi:endonuclease/exonuclease/phosphatase family metal-dependent hydrolase
MGSVEWDVALLQEAPPRWREALARELGAESAVTFTSRNSAAPIRSWIADRWPNLIKSNEGGSNQLLVRQPWRVADVGEHTLAVQPERRRMLWARLAGPEGAGLAVANLHGSVDSVPDADGQVLRAAERAVAWAGDLPLIFGGDLNLRPGRQPGVFEELERRFRLAPPTAPDAIDHLLMRGLDVLEEPRRCDARDPQGLQLSDHAYVTAAVSMK